MKYLTPLFVLIILVCFISGCVNTDQVQSELKTPSVSSVFKERPDGDLNVHFIDVGQGDSELIQFSGKNLLIDAGDPDHGSNLVQYLKEQGVVRLDIVIATHPHSDHIGGMIAVLNAFQVDRFIDSGYPHTTPIYKNMLAVIEKKKIPFSTVRSGDSISFVPGITLNVLNPPSSFYTDINENSIVLKLTDGNVKYLFMGDATTVSEEKILSENYDISADILKVGHHGSKDATGGTFVSKVKPKTSVFELGKDNEYGYPKQVVVNLLKSSGSQIYRTDLEGNIRITSNGTKYIVTTHGSP